MGRSLAGNMQTIKNQKEETQERRMQRDRLQVAISTGLLTSGEQRHFYNGWWLHPVCEGWQAMGAGRSASQRKVTDKGLSFNLPSFNLRCIGNVSDCWTGQIVFMWYYSMWATENAEWLRKATHLRQAVETSREQLPSALISKALCMWPLTKRKVQYSSLLWLIR